jgi:RNA polymerase sigma-70 factor (ECF subfamily)
VTASADDVAVVTCIREGTDHDARAAFDALYARTYERLTRFAERWIGDAEIAFDVVQDTFVSLWITRASWFAPGGMDAYLYIAVRNRVLKRIRHADVTMRANPSRIPGPVAPVAPDTVIEMKEFEVALEVALGELSERRRAAFLLHVLDDLSYEAIGDVLGISKPAAYKQVLAALTTLRARLSHFAG